MKVQKSKYIQIQLTILATVGIIFSVLFVYFLGYEFEIKSFSVALGILIVLLFMLWLIVFLLIKFQKKYYIIESDRITLWRKNELLCELNKTEIFEVRYVRFFWALLMQMGAGYLNLYCPVEALKDKKFASLVMPNGTAIFEISMSKKQAKKVAKILSVGLKIQ